MRVLLRLAVVFVLGALTSVVICAAYLGARNWRREGEVDSCYSNLATMSRAMSEYAVSHDNFLPPSLDALIDEQILTEDRLRCPTSGRRYLYLAGQKQLTWAELSPMGAIVVEEGFPHRVTGPELAFKHYLRPLLGVSSVSVRQFSEGLEKEPSEFVEIMKRAHR